MTTTEEQEDGGGIGVGTIMIALLMMVMAFFSGFNLGHRRGVEFVVSNQKAQDDSSREALNRCFQERVELASKKVIHEYNVALNLLQFPDSDPSRPISVNHSAFMSGCDGSDLERIKGFLQTMISKDWKEHPECMDEEAKKAQAEISYNTMFQNQENSTGIRLSYEQKPKEE